MDPILAEAFFNRRQHIVLGAELRPLCLWHSFVFDALGLPGLQLVPENLVELNAAVGVAQLDALEWGKISVLGFEHFDFESELAKWRDYIADYLALPEFFESEHARPVKSQWQLFRAAQLMRYAGWSTRRAWSEPIGRAVWTATALAEANGAAVDLINEHTREMLRAAGHQV